MTQEKLKSILHYEPTTGIFTRLIATNKKQKIGDIVGTKSHHSGYVAITLNKKIYQAHRLAWFYIHGIEPQHEIDHKNRIRNDNRISNLRETTKLENMKNVGMFKNNTSGTKGVRLFKRNINGKIYTSWLASLKVNGIFVLKKYYQDINNAIEARKEAEQKHGIL